MKLRNSKTRGNLRVVRKPEEFNPMEGVGNMADAMLVFACGLLLALIMSWNVNLDEFGAITDSPNSNDKYEINDYNSGSTQQIDADNQLQELGKVYLDPAKGKYYVIENQ